MGTNSILGHYGYRTFIIRILFQINPANENSFTTRFFYKYDRNA